MSAAPPLFTRRFFGLWAFAFITFFSAFQLFPAIPLRILQLGGSKATAGWFLTVYTFASALAAPLMGSVADHIGRKRLLVIASLFFIVFSVLYGLVTEIGPLLVIGIVHGAIWSALLSSASAVMSDYIPEARRTEGLAYWGLAGNAAIALAPAVGIALFYRAGWVVLCVELAALSVVMLIGSSLLPIADTRKGGGLPSLRDAWDWKVTRVAVSMGVIAFGYGGVTSFVAIFAEERGIEPKSLYFTVLAAGVVLLRVFVARLGDRYGPKALLYPSFAAIPLSFAVLSVAETRWELVVSAALLGLGFGGAWPAFASYVLQHTDPARRARTFGSIVLAFDVGIGTGSLAVGAISEHRGLGFAFGVAAAVSCFAIPIFIAGSRSLVVNGGVTAKLEPCETD